MKAPPGKYPLEMQIIGSKVGAMKRYMINKTYKNCVWKRKSDGFFNTGKFILLMDSVKSHFGDEGEQAFSDVNTSVKIIHGRMTPYCSF